MDGLPHGRIVDFAVAVDQRIAHRNRLSEVRQLRGDVPEPLAIVG